MLKIKTHHAHAKSFHVTSSGEFKRNKAYKSHILEKKTRKRKRNLHNATLSSAADHARVRKMLPYA